MTVRHNDKEKRRYSHFKKAALLAGGALLGIAAYRNIPNIYETALEYERATRIQRAALAEHLGVAADYAQRQFCTYHRRTRHARQFAWQNLTQRRIPWF